MSGAEDIELVQGGIDGLLSETQCEQLRQRLSASPELRAYQAQLRDLADVLNNVPSLEPPADLRRDLLQRLSRQGTHKNHFTSIGRLWAPPALRYATAFAAGLGICAMLYETASLDNQTPEQLARLAGTMLHDEHPPGAIREDRLVLAKSEVKGDVTLHRISDGWIVDFRLDSPAPVAMDLGLGGLPFRGFAQLRNELAEVSVTDGAIKLVSEGRQEFAVFLGQGAASGARLNLRFYADGALVTGGSLDTPR